MTTMEHPRAISPTQHMINVHPRDVAEDDIMKHLGHWCTVTRRIDKTDGSTVIYFKELSNGALIPMIIPEGTMGVSVVREKSGGICPRCRRDTSVCICDVD